MADTEAAFEHEQRNSLAASEHLAISKARCSQRFSEIRIAGNLVEEPYPLLAFIDPVF